MTRAGIPLALLAAALFGASTPLAKLLLAAVDPRMLAGLLYLGAGSGLAVVDLSRLAGRRAVAASRPAAGLAVRQEAPLRRADLPCLCLVILAGGVGGPVLLMLGLARTDAAGASLLLNCEALATMVLAWLVFHEAVDRRLLLGAAAILAGAALLSWHGRLVPDRGALLIVGACLCWGIDNNLTRRLSAADPVRIAMIKGLAAGVLNLCLALAAGAALPPLPLIGATAIVGFLGYGVSLACFVLALRHLGAARTGAYFSLAPFVGAVLAVCLLGDPLSPRLLAAAALMGAGLWLHLCERHEHDHLHEPLGHEHRHRHDTHHRHHHPGPHPDHWRDHGDSGDRPETGYSGHGHSQDDHSDHDRSDHDRSDHDRSDHDCGAQDFDEPHTHWHPHEPLRHRHPHYPDLHHRHRHPR